MIRTATKPKTARGKRALKERESKVIENVKSALFIKGSRTSQIVNDALVDLCTLKKPHAVMFNKKNELHPFDDHASLEFFSQKNDASLFCFGSHSKKRPNHITFGRMFDGRLLDMVEVGIEKMIPVRELSKAGCGLGQKPLFLFSGEEFEQKEEYKTFKNLLLDFYRNEKIDKVSLKGLEHVVSVTADPTKPGVVYFRVYAIVLLKSASRVPRVELEQLGPFFDFKIDRVRLADNETWKQAVKVPRVIKPKKVKNISKDTLGDTFGRVHVGRQDLGKLQTRKMKGLKRKPIGEDADESNKRSKSQE